MARKPYPIHRRWRHMNYLPRVALAPSFALLLPRRSTLFLPSTADDDGKTGSSAGTKSTTTNGSTGESSNTNRKCEDINDISSSASAARAPPFPPTWRGTWTCTGLRWRPSTTTRFLSFGSYKWRKFRVFSHIEFLPRFLTSMGNN